MSLSKWLGWLSGAGDGYAVALVPPMAEPVTIPPRTVTVDYARRDILVNRKWRYHLCLPDPQDPNCWPLHCPNGVAFVFLNRDPVWSDEFYARAALAQAVAQLLRYNELP